MQRTELASTMVQTGLARSRAEGSAVSRLQRYGPYAIALYLLATTRWGSALSLLGGPPYLSDMALILLLVDRASAAAAKRSAAIGVESWAAIFGGALLAWCLILLAFGSISQNALRDAAPYLYAVTVFLVQPPVAHAERTAARALTAVLVFHATWVTLALLDPSLPNATPVLSTGIHMLSLRPDIDSLVCGLLAALGLHRALAGRSTAFNLALAAWGAVLVFALYDRAGLLAFVVQIVVVVLLGPARKRFRGGHDRRLVAAVLVIVIPIFGFEAVQSKPVQRLLLTTSSSPASTEIQGSVGTANARLNAWKALVHYLEADPSRELRGVGFGPDFLQESGAEVLLLGANNQEDVRSPHNYLLNTWARTGLVGLILVLGLLSAGLRLAYLIAKRVQHVRDDDVVAILLLASIPIVAFLGVVLESPFGAIPYFWAIGHLSARACQSGVVRPFGARAR